MDKPEFVIHCRCGNIIKKEVKHRHTTTMSCINCGARYESYNYFRRLPEPPCHCDDLVRLGVSEAMRTCRGCE